MISWGGKFGWVMTEHGSTYSGEPVFLVRAKDATAVAVILEHVEAAKAMGASDKYINDTLTRVDEFQSWQASNSDLVKTPDN